MTLQQLQNLTLDDLFFQALNELVDFSRVPEGESSYLLDNTVGTQYSRLQVHSSLTKPTLEAMTTRFELIKAQLIQVEQNRLDELVRIAAIEARLAVFSSDPMVPSIRLGLHMEQPNWAIINKQIIEQNNIELLEEMEAEWTAYQAELVAANEQSTVDRLRSERNAQLLATDYTQLADAPLTSAQKTEYRSYRNYLRSLPAIWEGGHIAEPICLDFVDWQANPPIYPEGI